MIITAENLSQNAFHRFASHRGLESHRTGPACTPEELGQSWLEQAMSNSLVSVTEFGCCLQQENTLRGQQLGNSGKISLAESYKAKQGRRNSQANLVHSSETKLV